jgi:molybdopterin-guanine dinucleotide biosynthesis protein A
LQFKDLHILSGAIAPLFSIIKWVVSIGGKTGGSGFMESYGCYILAGGKSSRMGQNKAFVCVGETVMIERQLDLLSGIFPDIIIITNDPTEYSHLNYPLLGDEKRGLGPIGGILTALKHSKYDKNFIIACDMPFPEKKLIELLLRKSNDSDITIICDGSYFEPLFAVYDRRCIPAIENYVNSGGKKITGFYDNSQLVVHAVDIEEVKIVDAGLASLFNINTRHDLLKANQRY